MFFQHVAKCWLSVEMSLNRNIIKQVIDQSSKFVVYLLLVFSHFLKTGNCTIFVAFCKY